MGHFYRSEKTKGIYVKMETTKILKQHKAYMAQFEEMLNDEKVA